MQTAFQGVLTGVRYPSASMAGNTLPRTRLHLSADLKRELKLSGAKQLSSFRETVLEVGAIFVQGRRVGERCRAQHSSGSCVGQADTNGFSRQHALQ